MKTLEIDMENCFGISKFEHKFDFADDTCVLIYAPNGMMKSSFARTFECISKDDKKSVPCDRDIRKEKPIALLNAMGNLLIQSQFSLRMLNPTLLQIIE